MNGDDDGASKLPTIILFFYKRILKVKLNSRCDDDDDDECPMRLL